MQEKCCGQNSHSKFFFNIGDKPLIIRKWLLFCDADVNLATHSPFFVHSKGHYKETIFCQQLKIRL